jgi:inorganic pyrophosphatase
MGTYFLVVVWLTFSDGGAIPYNADQKWDHAKDFKTCTEMLKTRVDEMTEKYKEYEGSTFVTGCPKKGKGVKDA